MASNSGNGQNKLNKSLISQNAAIAYNRSKMSTHEFREYIKGVNEAQELSDFTKELQSRNGLYKYMDNDDITLNELANQNTAQMQAYNATEAEKNRQWQTQMSNTSHQREVADLRAAGLNPVLSANSGATAYTSSPASSTIDSALSAIANKEMNRLTTASTIKAAEISAEMVGEAAKISAEASKYASNMAYKSTKYSANKGLAGMQASASATRAAAAATAGATQYAANMNYAGSKYTADHQKYGYGTSILNKSGFTKAVTSGLGKVVNYFKQHTY